MNITELIRLIENNPNKSKIVIEKNFYMKYGVLLFSSKERNEKNITKLSSVNGNQRIGGINITDDEIISLIDEEGFFDDFKVLLNSMIDLGLKSIEVDIKTFNKLRKYEENFNQISYKSSEEKVVKNLFRRKLEKMYLNFFEKRKKEYNRIVEYYSLYQMHYMLFSKTMFKNEEEFFNKLNKSSKIKSEKIFSYLYSENNFYFSLFAMFITFENKYNVALKMKKANIVENINIMLSTVRSENETKDIISNCTNLINKYNNLANSPEIDKKIMEITEYFKIEEQTDGFYQFFIYGNYVYINQNKSIDVDKDDVWEIFSKNLVLDIIGNKFFSKFINEKEAIDFIEDNSNYYKKYHNETEYFPINFRQKPLFIPLNIFRDEKSVIELMKFMSSIVYKYKNDLRRSLYKVDMEFDVSNMFTSLSSEHYLMKRYADTIYECFMDEIIMKKVREEELSKKLENMAFVKNELIIKKQKI